MAIPRHWLGKTWRDDLRSAVGWVGRRGARRRPQRTRSSPQLPPSRKRQNANDIPGWRGRSSHLHCGAQNSAAGWYGEVAHHEPCAPAFGSRSVPPLETQGCAPRRSAGRDALVGGLSSSVRTRSIWSRSTVEAAGVDSDTIDHIAVRIDSELPASFGAIMLRGGLWRQPKHPASRPNLTVTTNRRQTGECRSAADVDSERIRRLVSIICW